MIKKRRTPDIDNLMHRHSMIEPNHEDTLEDSQFRAILLDVEPGWPVISSTTNQRGTVVSVIRDKYGVPACLKVKYYTEWENNVRMTPADGADWGYDYIPIDRVSWCPWIENWSHEDRIGFQNDEEYREMEEYYVKTYNLTWDDNEGVYLDPNGEAFFW